MPTVMEIAEDLWTGRISTTTRHPLVAPLQELEELDRGVAFVSSFANVTALATEACLVLIDGGGYILARRIHASVGARPQRPLHTAVYTHGHVDHVFGVELYEKESRGEG